MTDTLNKNPDISIIVPIYNVEEYLAECLDSIVNQTKDNLEVIMVDDGSTDSSGEIAKEYAEMYPNFRYFHKENGGLGCARNYGVPFAQGKYIAFLDSDDIVTSTAYEKMFHLAEKNGSELTICNVARFNSKGVWSSSLHKRIFNSIEPLTHITKNPNLIFDTTSWNKLILKSFYLENNFSFPENILYEDLPVTIPMHYKANSVSIVTDIGYLWRTRDGASKSITQNTSDMQNLTDRLTVLKMIDKFFNENITDKKQFAVKDLKALEIDLMIFINVCNTVEAEQAYEMLRLIKDYIDKAVDKSVFPEMTLINQQKYEYALNNDLDGLIRILEYHKSGYYEAEIEEKDGKFFIDVPDDLFTIKNRDVTKELAYFEPRKYINDIVINKHGFEIYGHIYTRRVNIKDSSEQEVSAFLYNEMTGAYTPLKTESVKNDDLTSKKGIVFDPVFNKKTEYNYDGTGFKITIDLNEITIDEQNTGYNKILIKYKNRLTSGSLFLGAADSETKKKINSKNVLLENSSVQLYFSYLSELVVRIENKDCFAENVTCDNKQLLCTLENKALALWAEDRKEHIQIPFETEDGLNFSVNIDNFAFDTLYDLFAEKENGDIVPLMRRSTKISPIDVGDFAAIIRSNRTYCIRFELIGKAAFAKKISSENNVVSLKTISAGNSSDILSAQKAVLCVEDTITEDIVVLSKCNCKLKDGKIKCSFNIDFNNEEITKNLYQSYRDVFIEYRLTDGRTVRDLIYSSKYFNIECKFETLGLSLRRCVNGYARLKCDLLWREEENTAPKRKALTFENYPKYREEKINPKRIVFESMWGSKYSCNPQHLYEYIDKNYPGYECIWSLKDPRTPIKGNGIRVRRGSQEYYYYLATAKYFVNNVNFEDGYVKRKGQIEIQTMHGTPLKTLGLDVASDFPTEQSRIKYIEKNSRWNYLLVQGEFMESKADSCFNFNKDTLRCGYPRTDILFNNSQEKINSIKTKLGLPLDKKIILYTPTWRVRNRFDMQLDLEKMREKLSDNYILLVRLHHFSASGYTIPADDEFIFNFNSYRCVEELYMISDMLITDYSSVMFDYALLNKPMLFFTYDLEEYSERLRGLYVDIVKEAPGPLLYTSDEVIDAILNIDEETEKCRDRINAFHKKFLTYENADSCKMVVRKVFKPSIFDKYKKRKDKR